jgi:hypothetical protein
MANKTKEHYYLKGFDAGLDTATVITDRMFSPLLDSMRVTKRKLESLLEEEEARQVESFIDHSEIK